MPSPPLDDLMLSKRNEGHVTLAMVLLPPLRSQTLWTFWSILTPAKKLQITPAQPRKPQGLTRQLHKPAVLRSREVRPSKKAQLGIIPGIGRILKSEIASHSWLWSRYIWLDKQRWTRRFGQQANTNLSWWPAHIDLPIDFIHRAEAASLAKRSFQGASGVCTGIARASTTTQVISQQRMSSSSPPGAIHLLRWSITASHRFVAAIIVPVACCRSY